MLNYHFPTNVSFNKELCKPISCIEYAQYIKWVMSLLLFTLMLGGGNSLVKRLLDILQTKNRDATFLVATQELYNMVVNSQNFQAGTMHQGYKDTTIKLQ